MYELFNKVCDTVRPAMAFIGAAITYLLFPDTSFIGWCAAVWIAMLLDLFTRWRVIFKKNGGVVKAFQSKAWNSHDMFEKSKDKIITYLVIMVLAGLSYRLIDIPFISNAVATVVYAFLFFREFISNIENLIEAGADYLKPLLFWVKKKEKDVLKKEDENVEE
jgi:hypothetical protein